VVFELKSVKNQAQEDALQKRISLKIAHGSVNAIDTHKRADIGTPSFKLARTRDTSTKVSGPPLNGGDAVQDVELIPLPEFTNQSHNVITISSKPDCMCTSVPSWLEVKSKVEVR
jgi:hypothetical protein